MLACWQFHPVSKISSWVGLRGECARDQLLGFLPSGLCLLSGTVINSCFFRSDRVQALSYAQHTRQLISCGGDGGIVVWNMDVERQEVGVTAASGHPLRSHRAGLCSSDPAEKSLRLPSYSLLLSFMSKPWNKTCCVRKFKNSSMKGASFFYFNPSQIGT